MKKILVGLFVLFIGTAAHAACTSDQIDVLGDGTQCETAKFSIGTTNIAANDVFSFYMTATGTFYVDCGDGGTLSGTGASGKTITRTTITEDLYTCTYSTTGTKTVRFGGIATGYSNVETTAAIRFYQETNGTQSELASVSGNMSAMFPYITTNAQNGAQPRFYGTFGWCSNLTSISANLFSDYTIGSTNMFRETFLIAGLTSIPSGLFSNITTGAEAMFRSTFNNCTSLTFIPGNLFSGITVGAAYMFVGTFYLCTGLTSIPGNLFSGITTGAIYLFTDTFNECSSLTYIPESLFSGLTTTEASMFASTFANCTSLTSVPAGLFSNIRVGKYNIFGGTFAGCTSLTSIPAGLFSNITTGAYLMFRLTFYGCTNLSGYIPPSTFKTGMGSYTDMWNNTFDGTGLATSCPAGTVQYTTGYESSWDGKVSCVDANISCNAGNYLPAHAYECATCPAGNYCPGGTLAYNASNPSGITACPDAATHARTTFPANYYSPTITSIEMTAAQGKTDITECQILAWMTSPRGNLYEYANYNSNTNKYDNTAGYNWNAAAAGYYLTNKSSCGWYAYYDDAVECPAGSYCPGKEAVVCDSSNQSTVHTETFGLETCPSGYTSAAGATAQNQCYITVTGGHYIGTAGQNSTNWETCAAGYARAEHTVNYGSTSSCDNCASSNGVNGRKQYSDTTGASSCTECPTVTGTYADRLIIYDGWWPNDVQNSINGCIAFFTDVDPDATFKTLCYYGGDGYGDATSVCQVYGHYVYECAAGKYKTIETTNEWIQRSDNSAAGYGIDFMKGKVCTDTTAGYYSPDGALTQTQCPAGTYSSAGASSCTACTGATYSAAGAASCAACPTGYTYNTTNGKTSVSQCQANCAANTYINNSEYTQLEYLGSTGTQYIDTGIVASSTNYEVITSFIKSSSDAATILGNQYNDFQIWIQGSTMYVIWPDDSQTDGFTTTTFGFTPNNPYTIDIKYNNSSCTVNLNGTEQTISNNVSVSPVYTVLLFANRARSDGLPYDIGYVNISSVKMRNNNTLVRDFIPARRNSDNELGMYDLVTGTFFTNAGTGTFTAGPVVGAIGGICTACDTGYSSTAHTVSYGNSSACSANTININWDGLSGASATTQCTYDGAITTPTVMPTRRGHAFAGWTFTAQ